MSEQLRRKVREQVRHARRHAESGGAARPEERNGGPGPGSVEAPDAWEPLIPLGAAPTAEPFPDGIFPGPVERFYHRAREALSCPGDFLGVPMLTIAGGAIGASRALEVKPGWTERPSIYSAIVGRPGSIKTPAVKTVAAPVWSVQARLKAAWDEEMEEYEAKLAAYDAAKKKAKAEDQEPPQKPRKPMLRRVYASDTTTEALAPLLQENPRGVVLVRDELASLVAGLNQYKAGKGSDRQFYLAAWAGEPICVDRKAQTRGPIIVPHPFLCITGGLPPDLLAELRLKGHLDDGFLDRFLFCYPDHDPVPAWSRDSLSEEDAAGWRAALDELWKLNQEIDKEAHPRPYFVRLTGDGERAWADFYNGLASEVNGDNFPPHLLGPWSKLRGYCARLALVIHFLRFVTRDASEQSVDAASVGRAVRLVAYFKTHLRKVHAVIDADGEAEKARRVLEWVAREGRTSFKRWEVHKDLKNQKDFARVEDLDGPLGRLAKHHYLRLTQPARRGESGRHPDPVYEVSPLWDRRVNRKNRENPGPGDADGHLPNLPDSPDGSGSDWRCPDCEGSGCWESPPGHKNCAACHPPERE